MNGVRSESRLKSLANSLQGRVFLSVFMLGAIAVVLVVGISVQDERENAISTVGDGTEDVYAAWAGRYSLGEEDGRLAIEHSARAIRPRLTDAERDELLGHIDALMAGAELGYEFSTVDVLSRQEVNVMLADGVEPAGQVGSLQAILDEEQIRELRRQGYYWGEGRYHYQTPDPQGDQENPEQWIDTASGVPTVVWMTGEGTADYVQLRSDPAANGLGVSDPLRTNWPGYLLVTVVGIVAVGGLAYTVSLVAMRGADRSLRLVTTEAEAAATGGGEVVPLAGPPEIRRLTRAVNRLAAQTSRAQRAEQSFLLSVSHELKTPLTSLRGYGEGLKDGALEPAEAGAVIVTESTRLERFVQDLLDSARFGRGEFTVKHERVDLAALARDVVERHRASAEALGVALTVESDGDGEAEAVVDDALAVADPDRVVQVVSNLVENAVRCTAAGESVKVAVAPGTISVSDTGPGLGAEDLEHAFERFYLHNRYGRDRKVGTGLGLAIVKDLTEKMGGSVSVASEVGVGSTFTVRLPVEGVPAA